MLVDVVHSRPQRRGLIGRFDLDVDQRQPLFALTGPLRRHTLLRRQFANQIEDAARTFGRIQEDLFVQPLNAGGVQALRPLVEEQCQELGEEELNLDLESLVVIHDAASIRSAPI